MLATLLAACGEEPEAPRAQPLSIQPQDFVALPCGDLAFEHPCTLAIAGGKRVMFGAPAGAAQGLGSNDLRLLDAVLVFSLRARDLEGLDELRNESWQAGRAVPLLVIGPPGIEDVVDALNKTFEQSDALRIVEEGIPPGGYDAAVMTARAGARGQIVFDTGDVQVSIARAGFDVTYNATARFEIRTCEATDDNLSPPDETLLTVMRLGCDGARDDLLWPLDAPLIILKN